MYRGIQTYDTPTPAKVMGALNSSSTTSISVGDPIIYNEISGDEYSTLPVHEQHALRALRTTGPFTFKPEVLKQMAAARAQSSDDLDAVFFPPLVRVPKVG
jgi:hypothetical protein